MKKLSEMTGDSTQKVSKTLLDMNAAIGGIAKEINSTNLVAEEQAASTEEIVATLQEITANSQLLSEMAKMT